MRTTFASLSFACFRKEAEIQSVLQHPNIVETIAFSVGDAVNPPYLIMERMHESLFHRLKSNIGFPEALGIVLDVCKVSNVYCLTSTRPHVVESGRQAVAVFINVRN